MTTSNKTAIGVCVGCEREGVLVRTSAMLCYRCYADAGLRKEFGCGRGNASSRHAYGLDHEPTTAELDVMIAEQRANLPDWWHEEEEYQRAYGRAQADRVLSDFFGSRERCA